MWDALNSNFVGSKQFKGVLLQLNFQISFVILAYYSEVGMMLLRSYNSITNKSCYFNTWLA